MQVIGASEGSTALFVWHPASLVVDPKCSLAGAPIVVTRDPFNATHITTSNFDAHGLAELHAKLYPVLTNDGSVISPCHSLFCNPVLNVVNCAITVQNT